MHTKIKNTVWKGLAILLSILVIVLSGLGIVQCIQMGDGYMGADYI